MRWGFVLLTGGLAACSGSVEERDAAAEEAMLPVVSRVVAEEMPGVPVTPTAACIAANANEEETFQLVEAALQGTSGEDVQTILRIARRPETRACFFDAGVQVPL